jgi:dipeptidyl aminopeptidase/acylaminoacyl peptidase
MSVKRLTPVLLAVVLAAATVAVAPSVQGGTFPGDDGLIVFAADTDSEGPEDPEIWVVRPDGTGRQQLTDNDAKDNSPQWSADGTKIVFVSNRSGADQIWVMDADGRCLSLIVSAPSRSATVLPTLRILSNARADKPRDSTAPRNRALLELDSSQ